MNLNAIIRKVLQLSYTFIYRKKAWFIKRVWGSITYRTMVISILEGLAIHSIYLEDLSSEWNANSLHRECQKLGSAWYPAGNTYVLKEPSAVIPTVYTYVINTRHPEFKQIRLLESFCEQLMFSLLTGNADMHLKNFSLLHQPDVGPVLAPGYDMLATALVNPADDEDLALTLNGKKKKLKRADFTAAFETLKVGPRQQENIFSKMEQARARWIAFIDISFLSAEFKEGYKSLLQNRFNRLA